MAVRRIWLLNAPDNQHTTSDKMQVAIHLSISASDIENFQSYDYIRRYLGDPVAIVPTGPSETPDEVDETELTYYFRRYLCDPATESFYTNELSERVEVDLEYADSGANKGLLVCPVGSPEAGGPPSDGDCGAIV